MAHTLATVPQFKRLMVDGGIGMGTDNDGQILEFLEAASRRVEQYCSRSNVSGFGPRIGTSIYDTSGLRIGVSPFYGESWLELNDDLLSVPTTLALYDQRIGGTLFTLTEGTDFYLWPRNEPQKRRVVLNRTGSISSFFYTYGRIEFTACKWGFQDERVVTLTTVASGLASDATVTAFVTSASPDLEIGQTLYIGTEQLYLRELSGTSATVDRGCNGTTAAVHANAAPISVFRYPPSAVNGTLLIAQRRWRGREAGLTPDFGGQGAQGSHQDSENSILRSTCSDIQSNETYVG